MKRALATILITSLSLGLNLYPSTAAIKPGAICKKEGQVKKAGGKQYTCIKKGKKLAWSKGVTIKTAAPAATPTPTPAASASPTPTPKSTPTPTPTPYAKLFQLARPNIPNPMTWESVLERRSEAASIVYNDTWETIKRNRSLPDLKIPYQVFRGPNQDKSHFANMDIWLSDLFAFFGRAVKPDSYIFLAFPSQDLEWAVEQLAKPEISHPSYEVIVRNANTSPIGGFRQNAVPNMKTGRFDGIWLLPSSLSGTPGMPTRQMHEESTFNHEYGHQVQQAQWKDENLNGPNRGMGRDAPCFLIEGIVTIPELTMVLESANAFKQNLKNRTRGAYTSDPTTRDELGNFTGYSPLTDEITYEFALKYLDNSFMQNCSSGLQYGLSYSLGYLATEALAVIGGVESPMALFTLMGKHNLTWDQAFESIYEISWNKAKPILANYIFLQSKDYRS